MADCRAVDTRNALLSSADAKHDCSSGGAQVIRAVLKDPEDHTEMRLLYANSSPADVLLKAELEEFAREHDNFRVWFTGAVSALLMTLTP